MEIEKYFDFVAPDDVRLKGTRIGIESILYQYIYREQQPEKIVRQLPDLTLDQVYAAILYYLNNKEKMEMYLSDWLAHGESMRLNQRKNPPPVVLKLRRKKRKTQKVVTS